MSIGWPRIVQILILHSHSLCQHLPTDLSAYGEHKEAISTDSQTPGSCEGCWWHGGPPCSKASASLMVLVPRACLAWESCLSQPLVLSHPCCAGGQAFLCPLQDSCLMPLWEQAAWELGNQWHGGHDCKRTVLEWMFGANQSLCEFWHLNKRGAVEESYKKSFAGEVLFHHEHVIGVKNRAVLTELLFTLSQSGLAFIASICHIGNILETCPWQLQ